MLLYKSISLIITLFFNVDIWFSLLASLSRSMLNKSFDEIEIPPAPPGKCPAKLQVSIVYNMRGL